MPFGAQKTRDFQGPTPNTLVHGMERREGSVERETEERKEKAEVGKKRGFSGERDRREERKR